MEVRAHRIPLWELLALAVLVAAGFVLRTRDLTAFKTSPDDGQYMNSARLQVLEQGGSLAEWWAEDRAWFDELAADWGTSFQRATTYQHSYLHQFLFRCGYRLGLGRVEALRTNSAVLGTLTIAALYALYAWLWPARRRVGLVAAAILSGLLIHVFQSRTGWGQAGMSCFFVLYLGLGYRVLVQCGETETGRLARYGLLMALVSTLALGFQELISVLCVLMVLLAFAAPLWRGGERWTLAGALRSRRAWTVWLSAIPVGAYTLCLRLFSDYANEKWFALTLNEQTSWLELRRQTLDKWWRIDEFPVQISWAVIALAVVGAFSLRRRDRSAFRYLALSAAGSAGFLFLFFNLPHLLRIYLPAILIVVLFAAEGLCSLAERLGERAARPATALATLALAAWLGAVSWATLFAPNDHPLFVSGAYVQLPDMRHADRHWLEYLEDHGVTSEIGVAPAKDPLFTALDHGYRARLFSFDESTDTWPAHILCVKSFFAGQPQRVPESARYRLVAQDGNGRIGLYALGPRPE